MVSHVQPHTTLRGRESTDSPRILQGGRAPVSSAPPRFPRRIRPPPRQPKALPWKHGTKGMYRLPRSAKSRHPTARSTARDDSRLGSSCVGGGCDKEEIIPFRRGLDHAGGCSAVVRDESGICGRATLDTSTDPFVATWPDEEAADGLMHSGLLWRESGFGRETELATEGVPQEIAEACRPVRELLLCRLVLRSCLAMAKLVGHSSSGFFF